MNEPLKKAGQQPAPESYQPKDKPEMMRALETENQTNKRFEVKTANGGSYIDGVPRLQWGQWKDCTYSGSVTLLLNILGVPATYEQVAGLTGSCYRLGMCYDWDPGSLIVNTSYAYLKGFENACGTDSNANRAFGFDFYSVKDEAERDQKVRNSIDAGVPVLTLESIGEPEWELLTGYEKTEGGFRYFGRSYFDGDAAGRETRTEDGYTLAKGYPGEAPGLFVKFCDRRCEPLPAKEALRQSLDTALKMFGKPKKRTHKRMGYGAYEFMIDSLNSNGCGKDYQAHFSNLLDARRAAHIYLAQSPPLLAGENQARLLRAAALYQEMFDALSAVLPYAKQFDYEATPALTSDLSKEIAGVLEKMAVLEKQARILVKEILDHWEESK
jgi:hypothetical protein